MSIETETEVRPLFLPSEEDEDVNLNGSAPQITWQSEGTSANKHDDDDWMSVDATDAEMSAAAPLDGQERNRSIPNDNLDKGSTSNKVASSSSLSSVSGVKQQNGKKRKTSPTNKLETCEFYLGTFLVGNAWSTAKGSGYVKPGDPICVERESPEEARPSKADVKGKGKGKQVTLFSMLKPQGKGAAAKKAKSNTIVRLTNERGFGEQ